MLIQKANHSDIDVLMSIFDKARGIMRSNGNYSQWTGGYPAKELIESDIDNGYCYKCVDESGEIVGVFAFIMGLEPTYINIYEGSWLNDNKYYGTIHRLGSTPESRGVAKACFEWCESQTADLRADTHNDNFIMQHALEKANFKYCGIIYLEDGSPRKAYQKIKNDL